jgi:TetR/AcrR family transcriptional regulator, cholesterol catabolism regulator
MATVTDRKMELLAAAGALFSRWGYHGTTVRDLARELDVQGGSIYAHIDSKEDLLWEIVDIVATRFQDMAAAISAELDPRERIDALIRGHLRTVAAELHFATVFFNEWTCLSDRRRARIAERRDAYEAVFRRTIEAGVKQGVFRVEHPKFAAIYLLSALNWSYQWFKPGASLRIDEVADYYGALTRRALGGPPRP